MCFLPWLMAGNTLSLLGQVFQVASDLAEVLIFSRDVRRMVI
jgi:hypothetical protein